MWDQIHPDLALRPSRSVVLTVAVCRDQTRRE
jgi:hypothetical protein